MIEIKTKNDNSIIKVISAGVVFNLILFLTKLYVGLSVNSICIWSDAMNNLADTLSCIVSLVFMYIAMRVGKNGISYVINKAEQLLSFVLAIVVAAVGFSFAYSSLERFMYPTPVWFSTKYFIVILATALAKLGMFLFYRFFSAKTSSPVIRVLAADSILDFFITTATLISFTLTRYTEFTIDAVFGIIISIIIVVNAIRMIKQSASSLLNIVSREKRDKFEEVISSFDSIEKNGEISYYIDRDEKVTASVEIILKANLSAEEFRIFSESVSQKCFEETGIYSKLIMN